MDIFNGTNTKRIFIERNNITVCVIHHDNFCYVEPNKKCKKSYEKMQKQKWTEHYIVLRGCLSSNIWYKNFFRYF